MLRRLFFRDFRNIRLLVDLGDLIFKFKYLVQEGK